MLRVFVFSQESRDGHINECSPMWFFSLPLCRIFGRWHFRRFLIFLFFHDIYNQKTGWPTNLTWFTLSQHKITDSTYCLPAIIHLVIPHSPLFPQQNALCRNKNAMYSWQPFGICGFLKLLIKWRKVSLVPIATCTSSPSIRHHVSIGLYCWNSLHFASWNPFYANSGKRQPSAECGCKRSREREWHTRGERQEGSCHTLTVWIRHRGINN